MTRVSVLEKVHKKGLFGDYENVKNEDLIKISEIKNLLIVQLVQYKDSLLSLKDFKIDDLTLDNQALKVNCNSNTRILWQAPKSWILISTRKDLLNDICEIFPQNDFAITDLSHSKTVIEIEGNNSKEVLKKGCPFDFNELKKDICINSTFNGLTITIDMLENEPMKIRLFALRSFGDSFYYSITDSCLEFGYKAI